MDTLWLAARFGAVNVLGRELGARELRHGLLAEAVYNAHLGYTSATDRAKWQGEHPESYRLLMEAMTAAKELGYE